MKAFEGIRGVLIDLEGVLYVGDQVIDGAVDTIDWLSEHQIPHRFVTNTTTQSRDELSRKMKARGFTVVPGDILSTPAAAAAYLRQQQLHSCFLVVSEAICDEFQEFTCVEVAPDAVVIGDIGKDWDYDLVNHIAQMVMAGAQLVALHKGKFWQTAEGLRVDIGAFVAGIEYVTGVEARVIGKPSAAFFQAGIEALQCPAESILMIGDDIESDVAGAQRCGMKGALVRTGKFRQEQLAASEILPDAVLDSIAELPRYL